MLMVLSNAPISGARIKADKRRLPELMKENGFVPPPQFRAMVMVITFNKRRNGILKEKHYVYNNWVYNGPGWNAASTVKIYAAIAAVQYIRQLGFNPNARLTFHGAAEQSFRLKELIEEALTPSNNLAYNRLLQFVGFDRMHGQFLTQQNGFTQTTLARAYGGGGWKRLGEPSSMRSSPAITIELAGKKKELPKRNGKVKTTHSGTCTSVYELAMTMRKLMLQEQLLPRDTFRLKTSDLYMIRRALRADRGRGEEAVHALQAVLPDPGMKFYHKGGYFDQWYSDNIYVYWPGNRKAWIISMSAHAGRDGLNEAAKILGSLIKENKL